MNLYLQFLLFTFAGWVNRHQQAAIEYLQAENQALREQLGNKRIRWTDAQRRRLAEKAKAIGRAALHQLGTVVTPDTLLRWYRNLVAAKYDGSVPLDPGRPPTKTDIVGFIVRMAKENPSWGYTRMRGALYNLSHEVARNLTDCVDGFLKHTKYLILDRDPLYTQAFREMLKGSGVKVVRLPARSPNLNSYAERWIRSVRAECLSRMIPLGERHLRHLLSEYLLHFHQERNHQGLDNRIIEPLAANSGDGVVQQRARLGGVLNYYHREAA